MAVTPSVDIAPTPAQPVALRHFARLKLRILANGFRGRAFRVVSFVVGVLFGLYLAGMGFLLFAISAAGDHQVRLMVASLGGGLLVLGSVLLPVIWFGVDDTLDPARFALLPISRGRLVAGLLVTAAMGVPGAALLVATAGLLVPAAVHGGPAAALVQVVGTVVALALCLAAGRAVTSTFATTLRSRRIRDLLWVLIACAAALLGPLQLAVVSSLQRAEWEQLTEVAQVIGWTPLGAPYTAGLEMAEGRPVAALAKLAIAAAAVAGLLWWWGRTIESALAGGAGSGSTRVRRRGRGGASAQLAPRLLPGLGGSAFGALLAREVRYWWRDVRRRASLITLIIVGLFVPVLVTAGPGAFAFGAEDAGPSLSVSEGGFGLVVVYLSLLFVSALAASALANQFGYDGTAYAANLSAGIPGRLELRARMAAHVLLVLPLLLVAGVIVAMVHGSPALAPGGWGVLLAGYGTGLAVNQLLSVLAPYALPETSNPFATGTGSATAKSFLAVVAVVAAAAAAVPVLLAAVLLGDAWPWLAIPVGAAYGGAAALLGSYLAGKQLDARAPELLTAVTPTR